MNERRLARLRWSVRGRYAHPSRTFDAHDPTATDFRPPGRCVTGFDDPTFWVATADQRALHRPAWAQRAEARPLSTALRALALVQTLAAHGVQDVRVRTSEGCVALFADASLLLAAPESELASLRRGEQAARIRRIQEHYARDAA